MKIVNLGKETFWRFLSDTGDMFRGWIVPCRYLAPAPPLQSGLHWVEEHLLREIETQSFDRTCSLCGQEYHGPRLVEEPKNLSEMTEAELNDLLNRAAYAAEQIVALEWERKRQAIEQTPGLSLWNRKPYRS